MRNYTYFWVKRNTGIHIHDIYFFWCGFELVPCKNAWVIKKEQEKQGPSCKRRDPHVCHILSHVGRIFAHGL
ncbi:hypothetical protein V6Z11_A06G079000 [Gossypium hirsutum]